MVVRATLKYDDPPLKMSHYIIFQCPLTTMHHLYNIYYYYHYYYCVALLDLAVDVVQSVADVANTEVSVEHKLETSRRLIEVQFVLARLETLQAMNTAAHAYS